MSECINSTQRVLLRDLIASKLIESRTLVGRQHSFLAPNRTAEEMDAARKEYLAEYRRTHDAEIKAYQKAYRDSHRENKRKYDRKYSKKMREQEKENATD